MKTIQDKLRTRITTIRTLRDSRCSLLRQENGQIQHMRDFPICCMSHTQILHTERDRAVCNMNAICVITIVIVKAETCHKHSKRKHQLFS